MNYFIKNIHVNKLFHLSNFDIPIANEKYPHLVITGKNGSGKTILLNALTDFLDHIKKDKNLYFLQYGDWVKNGEQNLQNAQTEEARTKAELNLRESRQRYDSLYGKINIEFGNVANIVKKYQEDNFILVAYEAYRKPAMQEPENPTKPVYNKNGDVKDTATSQFLNFLSDLKIQEALARNEKQIKDADEIGAWFKDFEGLMRQIYQDDNLKLEFNYRDYSFRICTEGKKFKFTEVSDGFAAVLDIVADLILKMQDGKSLTRIYQKEGIVLIDEIETHLHLALQKVIMPLLTRVFPNIQFIITTHSPFVLSSMPNAVAYDLEHREVLDDLTEYSYESLAEGYFGVATPSSYVEMQLDCFKKLVLKKDLTDADKVELKRLKADFEKMNEVVSPLIVGEFRQIAIQNADKLKDL